MVDEPEAQQPRSVAVWFALAIAPFLALVAWHWSLGPLAGFGDWSHYLLHADALYRGRSYTDTGYIFTSLNPFIGPEAQPPGLPATLAAIMAVAGGSRDLTIYKLLMVAFAIAFLAFAFIFVNRRAGPAIAAATTMIVGLWLEIGFVTNAVQPDVGFSAFIFAIFCIADRKDRWTWGQVVAVTVLGIAALSFRIAAVPLVPALGIYAFLHRRELGWRPLIPAAVWSAGGLVAAIVVPNVLTFARLITDDPGRTTRSIVEAAQVYPFAIVELLLYPFPWNRANDLYHAAFAGLTVIGTYVWLRREYRGFAAIFIVFYAAMLGVFPAQDGRYLMPVAPLILYATWLGASTTFAWITARVNHQPSANHTAGRLIVATAGVVSVLTLIAQMRQPPPQPLLDVPGVRSVFSLLRAENAKSPVRAVFVNPRVLTWETGVPAMGFFDVSPDSTLAEFRAKRITHVVVGDVNTDPRHAPFIEAAVTARPDAFRSIYAEGVFTVFRFDSTRTPTP